MGGKFVGWVISCPSAKLKFIKEGYITKTIDFDSLRKVDNYCSRDSLIVKLDLLKN